MTFQYSNSCLNFSFFLFSFGDVELSDAPNVELSDAPDVELSDAPPTEMQVISAVLCYFAISI